MAIQLPYTGVTTNETIPAPYTNGGGSIDLTLKEDKANKGVANGYAPLDVSSKVPTVNLPNFPYTFRTLFATTTVSNVSDTRYFSTIDAVGPVSALELRNFKLPYLFRVVACSATIYNTSANALASERGGTVGFNLVAKASEASTSSGSIYSLFSNWTLGIAGNGMTSFSSTLSPIVISAGTNLAMQVVFTNLVGASLRGELTLYTV